MMPKPKPLTPTQRLAEIEKMSLRIRKMYSTTSSLFSNGWFAVKGHDLNAIYSLAKGAKKK